MPGMADKNFISSYLIILIIDENIHKSRYLWDTTLERDLASPSIKSLEKIAEALNTKVGCFFFEKAEREGCVFIKKGMGKKTIDKEHNIASETLASGLLNIKMDYCLILHKRKKE